jgi:hypothetical protein
MNSIRNLICWGAAALFIGAGNAPPVAEETAVEVIPAAPTTVVPVPEADQLYSTVTPVDTIIVDKNGNMTETQYNYDPDQGGVVINNYNEVAGPGASLFFPAMTVGMLWWGGYWVDHNGDYWNGRTYVQVNDPHWHDNWDHYWKGNWDNKWNQYREQHPEAQNRYRRDGGTFLHRQGMDRRANPPGRRGGERGGARR